MARLIHIVLFIATISFAIASSPATAQPNPNSFVLGLRKDAATNQYYTSLTVGLSPPVGLDLVVDLATQFLWFDCTSGYTSSSYRPVPCDSPKCDLAKGSGCVGCNAPFRPGCTNDTCGMAVAGPFHEFLVSEGLGEDAVAVPSGRFGSALLHPRLLFSCGSTESLVGLASNTKGVLGLAKTAVSLPSQLASAFKTQRKFSLCLPSATSRGRVRIGDATLDGVPTVKLTSVPLITNPVSTAKIFSEGDPSDEYFMDVEAIAIDGKALSIKKSLLSIDEKGNGGTKFSTINPYTVLEASIYKALVRDFTKKAKSLKIKSLSPTTPFTACFDATTVGKSETGPAVPAIDLLLPGGKTWRINGANSMVSVSDNAMCLGFVDGGKKPRTSIVIGGFQLEDNLVEFDPQSQKIGFSSSLLLQNTSCSQSISVASI